MNYWKNTWPFMTCNIKNCTMTNSPYKETITIPTFAAGPDNTLSISYLMRYLQEAAANHASRLGVGFEQLSPQQLFWVLSRLHMEAIHLPKMGETITIETWPREMIRLFSVRDFIVRDANDQVIIKATTDWLMLNAQNLRPQRLNKWADQIAYTPDQTAIPGLVRDLPSLPEETSGVCRQVTYSDIDMNHHVNNARYLDWFLDAIAQQQPMTSAIHSVELNFLNEFKLNDTATIVLDELSPGNIHLEARKNGHHSGGVKGVISFRQ
ncbi:acyl-ACP thioesterase [Marinilabiliaceae bacterium JC017]|nr:acyl-ACP thioesterase [Marinilabiliaceae bacterium JC017]